MGVDPTVERLQSLPSWDWPDGSRDALLDVIRDDDADASDRVLACRLVGDVSVVDDAVIETLLALQRDGDAPEEVRAAAAISLGPWLEFAGDFTSDADFGLETEEPTTEVSDSVVAEVQSALREIHENIDAPKLLRRRALEASVRLPQSWHAEAIRFAYESADPEWKLTAVFAMSWVAGFADEILSALESGDDALKCEAIYAAGANEIDAAWPQVKRLLTARGVEKRLRMAAIEVAPLLRPDESLLLLDTLSRSDDEEIASAAEEALLFAEIPLDEEET